ncbi:Double-strand break repair protein MRE11 [Nymphon striatum]|nr:Double-strand break repair protein MRE11 [Nymphon striatum]
MASESDSTKEKDTFRILVATDCHLGFQEKDPIRGNDSMVTFEEILSIGKKREVDFIFLAGDLFHENKPSRKILHDTMQLLRKYCFGDKPVPFQFVSQQEENFKHCSFPIVNYEDPNYNVGIPVFSIHGNHDDPAGNGSLCSLDLLSVSGFVNYFGKFTDLESINISPILLQKGITKLAMYGLGSMKDERLHRMMRDGNVFMLCPKVESSESEWFNLMAIHQNRVRHGATNFIPEEFLDDLLDLVIWGHEHECRIEPEWNSHQNFYVSQPGSSVATSLCHAETVPKHVGILEIYKKDFRMIKIALQTVRPMYVEDINLQECKINYDLTMEENVMEYCKQKLDTILIKAEYDHTGHEKQPTLPLVRLRVEHTQDDQIFSIHRFGQLYVHKVANPKDLIIFHRRRADKDYRYKDIGDDFKNIFSTLNREDIETTRVEDVVKSVFENLDENKQLMLLTEEGLTEALQEFVDKEETTAISEFVAYQVKKVQKHLQTQQEFDEDNIEENIISFKKENLEMSKSNINSLNTKHNSNLAERHKGGNSSDHDDMDVDDNLETDSISYQNKGTLSNVSKKRQGKKLSISAAKSDTDNSSTSKRKKSNFNNKESFYSTIEEDNTSVTGNSGDNSDNEVSVSNSRGVPNKSQQNSLVRRGRGSRSTVVRGKNKTVSNVKLKKDSPIKNKASSPGDISRWFKKTPKVISVSGSDSDSNDMNTQSTSRQPSMRSANSRKGLVFFDDDD